MGVSVKTINQVTECFDEEKHNIDVILKYFTSVLYQTMQMIPPEVHKIVCQGLLNSVKISVLLVFIVPFSTNRRKRKIKFLTNSDTYIRILRKNKTKKKKKTELKVYLSQENRLGIPRRNPV